MATVLSFLSFFGILIGLVSVTYPLRFLYIRNRRTAAVVMGASVTIFLPALMIDGLKQQAMARQEQDITLQEQAATIPALKSPTELADEACRAPGAIADCKEILTRQIAEERAHPKTPEPAPPIASREGSCKSDWRQCSDNSELVNKFEEISHGSLSCQYAAKKLAKYGTPSFPFLSFSNFRSGNDFVRTGLARLVEPDAQFQNGYGALVHSVVTCKYDLNSRQVVDVSIDP